MNKKIISIFSIGAIGISIAFAFQNCSNNGFDTTSESANLTAQGRNNDLLGTCGDAQGSYTSIETVFRNGFCQSGSPVPSSPQFPEPGMNMTYSCVGRDEIINCSVSRNQIHGLPINGQCGSAQGTYSTGSTTLRAQLCMAGTAQPSSPSLPTPGGTNSYTCLGADGGTSATCSVTLAQGNLMVNGTCGAAQGSYLATDLTYRSPLCSQGTANPINPVFPNSGTSTTYSCQGSNGGTSVNCTMTRDLTNTGPVNAVCGLAQGSYSYSETSFRTPFCNVGGLSTSPGFPSAGSSTNYTCNGLNGGTSITCSVSREMTPPGAVVNGLCGHATGTYGVAETTPRSPFCLNGTPHPININFPALGASTVYSCLGANGGSNVTDCTMTRPSSTACNLPNYMYYNSSNVLVCGQCTTDTSYHSDSKKCVNHNFSSNIENFNSNPQVFRADFRIDVESEHLNDSTLEWSYLGAYNPLVNKWLLYDSSDKSWKEWPQSVVGTQMPTSPTSYPYLMLSVPTSDLTSLGGWEIKSGYGRGPDVQTAFNEMLSVGRINSMITINTQAFSASISGLPTTQIFSNTSYSVEFKLNPRSSEYGAPGYKYYLLALEPKDIRGTGLPVEDRIMIWDERKLNWIEIKLDSTGHWNSPIDGYVPYSEAVESDAMKSSKNYSKTFVLSKDEIAAIRGFHLQVGYAQSLEEYALNLANPAIGKASYNLSEIQTIMTCPLPTIATANCNAP
ncbi:MAG TPA: hypothetical protein PLJ21_03515 [Pseudobdellovibrionaceae bacterium]|nr:hypothetical protein [Pseudobdellovibrionaceae bacterium]